MRHVQNCTRRLSRLASCAYGARWLALSALTLACEPVVAPDASVPADATVSPAGDAGGADTGWADAGSLDAGSLDAGSLDAGSLDAGSLDAGALDAASSDAGALDSGAVLDGQASPDASDEASIPGDASLGDAEQLTVEHSGEVIWPVNAVQGSDQCPHQSIAMWKDETVTLRDESSPGFTCYLDCAPPSDVEGSEATFLYATFTHGLGVYLTFRARVMGDYSTQSFRDNFLRAQMTWTTQPKTQIGMYGVALSSMPPGPTVEILGYQAPMLHVRLHISTGWQTNSFDEQAVIPYFCVVQGKFGDVATICTHADCRYSTVDPASFTSLTLDLQVPIQAPAP